MISGAAPADAPAGPGADVWAHLSLTLESAVSELRRYNARRERLFASLHRVQLTGPPLTAAGQIVASPDLLGPRTGWWWDVRRLSFAAPSPADQWSGTIWVYNAMASPVNLLDTFTAAGPVTRWYPKAGVLLSAHEQLVYAAGADFDGVAVPGGEATEAADDTLPVYLS